MLIFPFSFCFGVNLLSAIHPDGEMGQVSFIYLLKKKKAIKAIFEGETECLQNTSGPQSAGGGKREAENRCGSWDGGVSWPAGT